MSFGIMRPTLLFLPAASSMLSLSLRVVCPKWSEILLTNVFYNFNRSTVVQAWWLCVLAVTCTSPGLLSPQELVRRIDRYSKFEFAIRYELIITRQGRPCSHAKSGGTHVSIPNSAVGRNCCLIMRNICLIRSPVYLKECLKLYWACLMCTTSGEGFCTKVPFVCHTLGWWYCMGVYSSINWDTTEDRLYIIIRDIQLRYAVLWQCGCSST